VDFQVSGSERRLGPETELALYRMAQEALNNIVRHAQAQQAWVDIRFEHDTLTLRVKDNGKGFLRSALSGDLVQKGHFGLLGLQERAELIHAQLQVDTAPGKGTTVSVILNQPAFDQERLSENDPG
jgi:two-component system, NarL family, sensor histidine kinase UhpB